MENTQQRHQEVIDQMNNLQINDVPSEIKSAFSKIINYDSKDLYVLQEITTELEGALKSFQPTDDQHHKYHRLSLLCKVINSSKMKALRVDIFAGFDSTKDDIIIQQLIKILINKIQIEKKDFATDEDRLYEFCNGLIKGSKTLEHNQNIIHAGDTLKSKSKMGKGFAVKGTKYQRDERFKEINADVKGAGYAIDIEIDKILARVDTFESYDKVSITKMCLKVLEKEVNKSLMHKDYALCAQALSNAELSNMDCNLKALINKARYNSQIQSFVGQETEKRNQEQQPSNQEEEKQGNTHVKNEIEKKKKKAKARHGKY